MNQSTITRATALYTLATRIMAATQLGPVATSRSTRALMEDWIGHMEVSITRYGPQGIRLSHALLAPRNEAALAPLASELHSLEHTAAAWMTGLEARDVDSAETWYAAYRASLGTLLNIDVLLQTDFWAPPATPWTGADAALRIFALGARGTAPLPLAHTDVHAIAVELQNRLALDPALLAEGIHDGARIRLLTLSQCARSSLREAHIEDCDGLGADFTQIDGSGSRWAHCDLRGAAFTRAALPGAVFHNCDLRGANFDGAIMVGANLAHSQTHSASFRGALLVNCQLPAMIYSAVE